MKTPKINRRVLNIFFISISILLIGFSVGTYYRIQKMTSTTRHLFDSYNSKALINLSLSTFMDIESSSRGYVLTKNTIFLSIRNRASENLSLLMMQMEHRFENSEIQLYYLKQLQELYSSYEQEFGKLITNNKSLNQKKLIENSFFITDKCRIQVNIMNREAERQLLEENTILNKLMGSTPVIFLLLIGLFILILLLSYFSILRQLIISKQLQSNYEESNISLEIANKSLAQSQAFLQSLLDTIPSLILTYEAIRDEKGDLEDFMVVFASGNLSILGDDMPETILGKRVSELNSLLRDIHFYNHLLAVTETGKAEKFQYSFTNEANKVSWYEIYISKFHDGITLNAIDITKIKLVEEELKNNIELLNERNVEVEEQKTYIYTIYNALLDSVVTFNDKLQVVSANRMFYATTETDSSIIGKHFNEIFTDLNYDDFVLLLNKALKGEYVYDREYLEPFSHQYFNNYMIPLKNNPGIIYGVILIAHNVDEHVKARRQINNYIKELQQANEQLRQFTFIASHDLQEPLRKIQMFANKVLNEHTDDAVLNAEVVKIRDAASRMSEMIIAITKYSQLNMDQSKLQWTDLNHVAQQVMIDLGKVIDEKNAMIQIDQLPTINCDPVQISQLFFHLLSNSLKFCKRKPIITIECTKLDGLSVADSPINTTGCYYRIRFTDNGIGFRNEYSDKIFFIFQRLNDQATYPGIGAGLALCHKIITNHKGKISTYSRENEGSTFDVYLPTSLSLT